ncbi:hypothetical protein F5Y13DRAFT_205777 [Hypoxylon sp. FL1857]|nr:hypothetical protein F5Y13DRAFT_205777 [Hypoxylon sp. FL1857]
MAFPPNYEDDYLVEEEIIPDEKETNIMQNDVHSANILLGEPPVDSEHTFLPIVKLIDFGAAVDSTIPGQGSGSQRNVWEIGQMMVCLITLERLRQCEPGAGNGEFSMITDGPKVKTDAGLLIPLDGPNKRYKATDPWLLTLACACLATNPESRPNLVELKKHVLEAVMIRDQEYYGREAESDEAINDLSRKLILEPND